MGYIKHRIPSWSKEVILILCRIGVGGLVLNIVCSSSLHNIYKKKKKNVKGLESVQRRAEKEAKRSLIALYSFLWRGNREGGAGLFSLVTNSKMCKNSTKLCQVRFRLDIWKIFFIVRVVKLCNRFPRQLIDAPYLSLFKRQLDNAFNML